MYKVIFAWVIVSPLDLLYYLATAGTFLFMFLLGKKIRAAWLIALVADILYAFYGFFIDSRAIILTSFIFVVLAFRGWLLWRK